MPETITIQELASLSGYSKRRLRQLGDEGKIPLAKNGELPFDAVKQLFAYLSRDSDQMRHEKTGKLAAERRLREAQASVAEGKFRPVEQFNRTLTILGAVLNSAITHQERPIAEAIFAALPSASEVGRPEIILAVQRALDAFRGVLANALVTAEVPGASEPEENS